MTSPPPLPVHCSELSIAKIFINTLGEPSKMFRAKKTSSQQAYLKFKQEQQTLSKNTMQTRHEKENVMQFVVTKK